MPNSKAKIILPTLILIVIFTKYMIWDDNNRRWIIEDIYYKPDSGYKATVASQISLVVKNSNNYTRVLLNDASKLQPTEASDYTIVKEKIPNLGRGKKS